jgi:hypothetical protein
MRASAGESFTPASSTYSNVIRLPSLQRKPLAGLDDVGHAVFRVDRNQPGALQIGRRVQGNRQVGHDRLMRQALEGGQQSDSRERDAARWQRKAVLVGQNPYRLHRLVVVVQRFPHAHQHDVERLVPEREGVGEEPRLVRQFRPP